MKLGEIKQCFASENQYKLSKQIKEHVQGDNQETINTSISAVKEVLQDPNSQPIQKVLALRVIKEIMDFHNTTVVNKVAAELLSIFEAILLTNTNILQNAKSYFSNTPDETLMVLGNTFIRLMIECIFVWNIWHGDMFSKTYNKLISNGIQFPKLFYFNSQKVREFYIQSKETSLNVVYSNNIEPDFFYIKKRLDGNQYTKNDIITIRNELLCNMSFNLAILKKINPYQQKFVSSFELAYQDYEKTQRYDEFQITIQSICLEYDDEVFDKQAAMDAFQKRYQSNQSNFTPSKIQGGGYSTDKISQFYSNGSISSQNSNEQQKQLKILNEKNRKIEQLLSENTLLQRQIKSFEDQISLLKNNGVTSSET